jgi:hypothetical protein
MGGAASPQNSKSSTAMFRMDQLLKDQIEIEYEHYQRKCPLLRRFEIIGWLLQRYEAAGKASRHVWKDGKTIAWKSTRLFNRQIAMQIAEMELEEIDES